MRTRSLVLSLLLAACGGPHVHATDMDHDGVTDAHDRCTRPGEDSVGRSDAHGCPESEQHVEDGDQDGDGVRDGADACPSEPAPGSANGCPEA